MEIVKHPAPILLRRTETIQNFDQPYLITLRALMRSVMKEANGQGLAANQINNAFAIALVSVQGYPELFLVNPVIIKSRGEELSREGCLSLPGQKFNVKRATAITVQYQDIEGKQHTVKARGELATCIQHEIDHLEGFTIKEKEENAEIRSNT